MANKQSILGTIGAGFEKFAARSPFATMLEKKMIPDEQKRQELIGGMVAGTGAAVAAPAIATTAGQAGSAIGDLAGNVGNFFGKNGGDILNNITKFKPTIGGTSQASPDEDPYMKIMEADEQNRLLRQKAYRSV